MAETRTWPTFERRANDLKNVYSREVARSLARMGVSTFDKYTYTASVSDTDWSKIPAGKGPRKGVSVYPIHPLNYTAGNALVQYHTFFIATKPIKVTAITFVATTAIASGLSVMVYKNTGTQAPGASGQQALGATALTAIAATSSPITLYDCTDTDWSTVSTEANRTSVYLEAGDRLCVKLSGDMSAGKGIALTLEYEHYSDTNTIMAVASPDAVTYGSNLEIIKTTTSDIYKFSHGSKLQSIWYTAAAASTVAATLSACVNDTACATIALDTLTPNAPAKITQFTGSPVFAANATLRWKVSASPTTLSRLCVAFEMTTEDDRIYLPLYYGAGTALMAAILDGAFAGGTGPNLSEDQFAAVFCASGGAYLALKSPLTYKTAAVLGGTVPDDEKSLKLGLYDPAAALATGYHFVVGQKSVVVDDTDSDPIARTAYLPAGAVVRNFISLATSAAPEAGESVSVTSLAVNPVWSLEIKAS